jgi:predicted Zn-dependent protease
MSLVIYQRILTYIPELLPMYRHLWNKFLLAMVGSVMMALVSCAVNPATGERHFSLVSESQEIQMGKESDAQIIASLGLYNDPAMAKYVEGIGMRLAAISERPNLPWTFRVIDDPVVNAFALPGGFIYVTRGILAHLNNEAELAGVMGHEVGHVTAQHSVNRIATQQITQLGLGIGMILKPELQQYGQIIGQGLGLMFLKFSRDDETQADALGVRYSYRIGDDPRQLLGVMTMLDRVTQAGGQRIPEWLATHPDPGNRKENIQANLDTIRGGFAGRTAGADNYLKHVDGLVYGPNPRDGFFRGTIFYQPEMKFSFAFPAGWQTANQRQSVQAVSPNKDAVIQITLSDKKTSAEAYKSISSQQGFTAEPGKAGQMHGLTFLGGGFSATGEQGTMRGFAWCIEYNGAIYQIVSYGTDAGWNGVRQAVQQAAGTFDRLTDQKILSVQPMRIKLVRLEKQMTLVQFNQQYPSPVSVETLAIINQVDANRPMPAGEMVKRIIGEKMQ